ncbi:MAG: T9SS type A sorting domain-containing protein [Lewinellaceae bacterium]|nr:T9SS type A sorting domain-containing protein [Phaeodactylibacter sp.]MCB9037292.1 T9SS type A sorting domain-containing protein [Lewinellaceae bacterium]
MKTKHLLYFLALSALFPVSLWPQAACEEAVDSYLLGNQVRALINNRGALFQPAGNGGFAYHVPFGFPLKHTICGQGLWLGGYVNGSLKLAAPEYDLRDEEFEYYPGPLDSVGQADPSGCSNWNRIWEVRRRQIEAHIADYEEDGIIDNPIPEIMGWPGRGNPYFDGLYGFLLPNEPQGLAPFYDRDGDGFYNPMGGEYPVAPRSAVLPEHLTWTVFNDAGGPHEGSGGEPLHVEVQQTAWAFFCEDNPQLNQAIFTSHKVINRNVLPIDSLILGQWHDLAIGCSSDDLFGSSPELHTIFQYNRGNIDGQYSNTSFCPEDSRFGMNPPVQAITFLNHPMSSAIYFFNFPSAYDPPFLTLAPNYPSQYYHYLNARWRNGQPLTFGGYGIATGNPPTSFFFSGDPNDSNSWSAIPQGVYSASENLLGNLNIGTLPPGAFIELDVAYSFFRAPGADHLGNVTAMYEGLENIHAWYGQGFFNACSPPDECQDDCVWAGDTNADGIANHYDVLPVGTALGQQGPIRATPLHWAPQNGQAWDDSLDNGVNYKHIDADGSGIIAFGDLQATRMHLGKSRPDYQPPPDVYTEGPELYTHDSMRFMMLDTNRFFTMRTELGLVPGLYGLAFTMEYDTNYLRNTGALITNSQVDAGRFGVIKAHPQEGNIDFGITLADTAQQLEPGRLMLSYFVPKSMDGQDLPSANTEIKIKNILGVRKDGSKIEMGARTLNIAFPSLLSNQKHPNDPGVQAFPNPATGRLELRFPGRQAEGIMILDIAGRKVWAQEGLFIDAASVDLRRLTRGTYFVRMQLDGAVVVRRIVLAQ